MRTYEILYEYIIKIKILFQNLSNFQEFFIL